MRRRGFAEGLSLVTDMVLIGLNGLTDCIVLRNSALSSSETIFLFLRKTLRIPGLCALLQPLSYDILANIYQLGKHMSDSYAVATQHFYTLLDFLRFGISRARAADLHYGHGTDNAEDDIRSLLLSSLSLPFDADSQWFHGRLTEEEKHLLCQRLEQRIIERIPVPYLTKEAYFCDLPFYVDERVLIPRSPLAEWIKQQFSPWVDADNVHAVLDLCTGSACIAIACCYAFPEAIVDAVDISKDALAVANINRENHGLTETLQLIESDVFHQVPLKSYDIIVSNPPYVSGNEMKTLPKEYAHEPHLALHAAHEGLAIVTKILNEAHRYLSPTGILVVEVGNSDEALIAAYPDVPFTWLDCELGGQGLFLLTAEQVTEHFASH